MNQDRSDSDSSFILQLSAASESSAHRPRAIARPGGAPALRKRAKRSHRGRSQPRISQIEATNICVEAIVGLVPVLPHNREIGVEVIMRFGPVLPRVPDNRCGSEGVVDADFAA
jgi:hypothetical protein